MQLTKHIAARFWVCLVDTLYLHEVDYRTPGFLAEDHNYPSWYSTGLTYITMKLKDRILGSHVICACQQGKKNSRFIADGDWIMAGIRILRAEKMSTIAQHKYGQSPATVEVGGLPYNRSECTPVILYEQLRKPALCLSCPGHIGSIR